MVERHRHARGSSRTPRGWFVAVVAAIGLTFGLAACSGSEPHPDPSIAQGFPTDAVPLPEATLIGSAPMGSGWSAAFQVPDAAAMKAALQGLVAAGFEQISAEESDNDNATYLLRDAAFTVTLAFLHSGNTFTVSYTVTPN